MANFNNALGTLGTASAPIYTSPTGGAAKGAIVTSCSFCNTTASGVPKLNVTLTSLAGAITKYVLFGATVPTNGTLTLKPEVQLILKPGDTLNAWSDTATALDYVLSATEL
jgi:hypothetical protein